MTFRRSHRIWAGTIAVATLLTGGMALREPEGPVRMSAMRIASLDGYSVSDWGGVPVGEIASVETDDQGRTRWLNIYLKQGGIARVASFRADLDAGRRTVSIRLPEGLLLARAV
ncbi:MAG: hypothetical protein QM773_05110 [Hyphomonadaceae bacterium]